VVDVKKRRCRDVPCSLLFLLFWVAIVGIIIYGNKKSESQGLKMMERALLLAKPGDKIRRMCGYPLDTQPDFLVLDYSSHIVGNKKLQLFCEIMQDEFSDDANLTAIKCDQLSSSATVRPFLEHLKPHLADMTELPIGFKTMSETVCIKTPCNEVPANASYVCQREFYLVAKHLLLAEDNSLNSMGENHEFISETDFLDIVSKSIKNNSDADFMKRFCVPLPEYGKEQEG